MTITLPRTVTFLSVTVPPPTLPLAHAGMDAASAKASARSSFAASPAARASIAASIANGSSL